MYPIDTANISDGTANHVYSVTSLGKDPNSDFSSDRSEGAAPADQPASMKIRHKVVGTGLTAETQSMIRFERVVEDGASNQGTVSAQFTLRWPAKICTAATAQKSINEFISFMGVAGYKDKFTATEP